MKEYLSKEEGENLFPYVEYPREISSNEDFGELTSETAKRDCSEFGKTGSGKIVLNWAKNNCVRFTND